ELLAHTADLKPRVLASVEEAGPDLIRNKDLARLECDLDLPIDVEDAVMGEWDRDEVRRLFTSLEFRTLLERLEELGSAGPAVERVELQLEEIDPKALRSALAGDAPRAVRARVDGKVLGLAFSAG